MSSGLPNPTVTHLYPYPLSYSLPANRYVCEAWWTCRSTAHHRWRNRSDCLLATGHPLSVVQPQIRHDLDLEVWQEPRWTGAIPDWDGIPCRLGRVEMWLPVQGNQPLRPFLLLVLLPRRTAWHALPYVYLGAQFLLEFRAQLTLDCSSGTPHALTGRLLIP